jgi:hypothetical protein
MILKNEAENFIKDILEKLLCTNINFKLIYFFFSVDFFEGRDQMNQQRLRNLWYTKMDNKQHIQMTLCQGNMNNTTCIIIVLILSLCELDNFISLFQYKIEVQTLRYQFLFMTTWTIYSGTSWGWTLFIK